ncbi:hypothetical protein HYC85_027742 [Camellia sinensis]|uniref:Reverse transcriptase domain-containing protein n=1 Tax=Camellia sinensis TaxID=4442 RepID=A0A7J7FU79_CAMSI|nr:hypothetical protein HYC85_027742 [Camellia sinensis]
MSTPTPSIGALSSLKALSVSQNNLNASLPIQGLCKLKKLEELDLNHNLFEEILPPCLSNLRSLNFFDISVVELISGNDKFQVETKYTDWIPMFQLNVLVLSNCNLNKLSADVSKFLLYQNKLRLIDLSHNNSTDSFTNWLLFLNLRNNSFVGQFCLPSYHYVNTYWMDVSNNHLSGLIHANMGNLSRNAFEGGIPSSFGTMSELVILDLSINNFSRYLGILKLSNNNFCGQIFSVIFTLTHIWHLQLNDNQFTRPLTNVLSKLSNLNFLDISNNYMSSKITSSMDNMTSLETLILRNNSIKTLFLLNPKLGSVELVHLRGNKFTRLIPRALFNSSNLLTFDIRENSFSGSILDSIGVVSNLRILLLRRNQLSGSIPTQLCQLNRISLMDLSHNYFNGSIPCCFGTIAFGMIEASLQGFMQMTAPLFNWHTFYKYKGFPERNFNIPHKNTLFASAMADEVEFVTKSRTYSYSIGRILNFMSGLDFSYNKLAGEIPFSGPLEGFFPTHRGLRQGDPLSPLLFILLMEALGHLLARVVQEGLLKGFEVGVVPGVVEVSHLFYADDALIFCDAEEEHIGHLRCVLCFEAVSGLRVNLAKSKLIPVLVATVKIGEGQSTVWNMQLRRNVQDWEQDQLVELLEKVKTLWFGIVLDPKDGLAQDVARVYPWRGVWVSGSPSKVAFLVWTTSLGGVLTIDNLIHR